jgi:hypothetical protein
MVFILLFTISGFLRVLNCAKQQAANSFSSLNSALTKLRGRRRAAIKLKRFQKVKGISSQRSTHN